MPISYAARSREKGKKLTWRDGVEALAILARERLRRRRADPTAVPLPTSDRGNAVIGTAADAVRPHTTRPGVTTPSSSDCLRRMRILGPDR